MESEDLDLEKENTMNNLWRNKTGGVKPISVELCVKELKKSWGERIILPLFHASNCN